MANRLKIPINRPRFGLTTVVNKKALLVAVILQLLLLVVYPCGSVAAATAVDTLVVTPTPTNNNNNNNNNHNPIGTKKKNTDIVVAPTIIATREKTEIEKATSKARMLNVCLIKQEKKLNAQEEKNSTKRQKRVRKGLAFLPFYSEWK